MTAPTYSERLSGLAKQIGLGRGRRASREGPEPVTPEIPPQSRSRRRGRPRSWDAARVRKAPSGYRRAIRIPLIIRNETSYAQLGQGTR
jgi:hypothetical protein